MKYKKYIILCLCIVIIGSYLLLKDKKGNISTASSSTEASDTNEQTSKSEKAENNSAGSNNNGNSASGGDEKPKRLDITMVDTVPNKVGNTSGNLQNTGFAAQQGKWMYYTHYTLNNSQYPMPLYRAMLDGETGLKILQENSQMTSINVVGEFIYYINPVEGRIYKIKTDETLKIPIFNTNTTSMQVDGDSIYFASQDETLTMPVFNANTTSMQVVGDSIYFASQNEGIIKIGIDGRYKQQITNDRVIDIISIVSDTIYYTKINESFQNPEIYKINTDGSNKKLISKDPCTNEIVQGDWIYYINYSDKHKLYKIKNDGTSKVKLLEQGIHAFNVSENAIYYSTIMEPQNLYRANIDGSKITRLTQNTSRNSTENDNNITAILHINLIGDNIFCSCATSSGFAILRVASDGSLVKLLKLS